MNNAGSTSWMLFHAEEQLKSTQWSGANRAALFSTLTIHFPVGNFKGDNGRKEYNSSLEGTTLSSGSNDKIWTPQDLLHL